jgi:hypothetical protein
VDVAFAAGGAMEVFSTPARKGRSGSWAFPLMRFRCW